MALLFMDSFDHYVQADMLEKYASTGSSNISTTGGRRSSGALTISFEYGSLTTRTFSPTPHATAIVCFAFKTPFPTNSVSGILQILSGATPQLSILVTTAGLLEVRRGGLGGTLLGTSSSGITANTFFSFEFKSAIHASTGTAVMRLNQTSVLNLSAINTSATGSAAWDTILLSGLTNSTVTFDDFYVLDGSATSPNDFLGDCRVDSRYPTAEGTTIGWTPLSGTDNALMVDETAPNDDTDYNSAAASALTDTLVVQDAPVVGAIIYGIQHVLSIKKSDAGTCTIAPVIRHSGTNNSGTAISPGTTYAYGLQVTTEIAPGVAITESNFNAAEFGYTRLT